MVRKTREEALETKNLLLDAAETVFYNKGFSSTTLMDVANEAGMTRGAIYWHFKNKSDLFEAMVERVKMPLESIFDESTADSETQPLARLREFSLHFLNKLAVDKRQQRVFTIMLYRFEMSGQSELVEERAKESFLRVEKRLFRALKNAVERGELPANTDIKTAVCYNHAFFTGIIHNFLYMPANMDLKSLATSLVNTHFQSLINNPPLK
ncbi:TetR family transcriptional regulator [Gayadomonas joobiniege]|uniref:TetR family transcriptional regulator n=1 Tax=Gayadomonas joobiniege TaxID=1234606 RepID=UPI0003663A13|nr:TetR family transcriptional regulator [Gayadomonas joobiniege]